MGQQAMMILILTIDFDFKKRDRNDSAKSGGKDCKINFLQTKTRRQGT